MYIIIRSKLASLSIQCEWLRNVDNSQTQFKTQIVQNHFLFEKELQSRSSWFFKGPWRISLIFSRLFAGEGVFDSFHYIPNRARMNPIDV